MTDPLVSIVINNYNYAAFVGEAIESALAQSYRQIEILVVDDGSSDDSASVIQRYADRVEVVLKQNGGQASAINLGAARARGDLVIFLDADDVLLPHIAEAVADVYRAQPNLSKAEYILAVIDASGQRTGERRPSEHLRPASGDLRRNELACPFDLVWMSMSGNAFAAHQFELQGIRHAIRRMRTATEYLEHKGLVAMRRRIGVSMLFKLAMLTWMVAMTIVPRPAAVWLARSMAAPQARPNWVNRLLSRA